MLHSPPNPGLTPIPPDDPNWTTPPNPGITAALLTAARAAEFIPIAGDVGRLAGQTLTIVRGDAPSIAAWTAVEGDVLPRGLAPRLLTRQVYDALRGGELRGTALVFQGQTYALADVWEGPFAALGGACAHVANLARIE